MNIQEFFDGASAIVNGARADQYGAGHHKDMMIRTAEVWTGVLGHFVSPQQVALCMVGLKLVRAEVNQANADHYVDILGYGAIAGAVADDVTVPDSLKAELAAARKRRGQVATAEAQASSIAYFDNEAAQRAMEMPDEEEDDYVNTEYVNDPPLPCEFCKVAHWGGCK